MNLRLLATKIAAVMVCLTVIMSMFCISVSANTANDGNADYDIVFVIDTSTSMKDSDRPKIAIQAVQLFVNQIPSAVTRFGVVAYGKENSVLPLTAEKDKIDSFVNGLSYYQRGTDIPEGLRGAQTLFEQGGANDNEKVIILLTDGINEATGRTDNQLKKDIESVESKGYKIFTIGLNCDGSVNEEYLKDIADKNNGKSFIVDSAEQLKSIFDQINSSIFDFEMANIDENGNFEITDDEVVEAIVDIYHESPISWTITGPNGEVYTSSSSNVPVVETNLYTDITIFNPSVGTWNVKYTRDSSDKNTRFVTTCMLSYNVSAEVKVDPNNIGTLNPANIFVSLNDTQKRITGRQDFFSKFTCKAVITYPDGTQDTINLNPGADGYSAKYYINGEKLGVYSVDCTVTGDRLTKTCPTATFEASAVGDVTGETNGSGGGSGGSQEDDNFPWWIIVIAVVLVIVIVVIILLKVFPPPKTRLCGVVEYEWSNDNCEYSEPFSSWNFDTMQVKEVSLYQMFNNNPSFEALKNVYLKGVKNPNNGLDSVGIYCKESNPDVMVTKSGVNVGSSPVVMEKGETVEISFNNPVRTTVKLILVR